MKKMTLLGLGLLSLVLAVALGRTGNGPPPVVEARPAYAESRRIHKGAPARQAVSHRHRVTRQTQPVHASLLAVVEVQTDSVHRSEALHRAIKSVSDADLPAMLDSLAHEVSPGAAELHQLLVRRWAETDARAVAEWTSQLPESGVRRTALEQVAIAWANTDLPAAAGWVRKLPEGDGKQAATLGLAYEAARTDPVAALELTSTLPPTLERDDLLVHAVSQWAVRDSTTAAIWAMKVLVPDLRQRLVASVAIVLAEQDGAAAATIAVNSLAAGEEQDRAAVAIVQRWAQHSPQAAASWVSQFPDTTARDAAPQNLLAVWTAQDSESAGNRLRETPVGSLRDVGIAAYTQALAVRDRTGTVARQNRFKSLTDIARIGNR